MDPFGVGEQRHGVGLRCQQRHRVGECVVVHGGELGQPGVAEEALHADRAGGEEIGQFVHVAWHQTRVEGGVDMELVLGGALLDVPRVERRRHRQRIQWHVDDGRDPARGGGGGAGVEAFPGLAGFGGPGVVEVDVGVDEPGQQGCIAEVGHGHADFGIDAINGNDHAVAHGDTRRTGAGGRDHPLAAQREGVVMSGASIQGCL